MDKTTTSSGTGADAVVRNLLDMHPATIPFADACKILGFPTTQAGYAARARGTFPVVACRIGAGLSVRTSVMIDYVLHGERHIATGRRANAAKCGRPTKSESVEATRRGITIRELRAQKSIKLLEGGV